MVDGVAVGAPKNMVPCFMKLSASGAAMVVGDAAFPEFCACCP